MNVLNPNPLTWCIYRLCTDVTNTSASMIFKTFNFFVNLGTYPREENPCWHLT